MISMESLPTEIQLEVVTPERELVHESTLSVSVPGKNGYLGILPGHAPLLSELQPGELSYNEDHKIRYLSVSWGFIEVLPERVIVLAQAAERAEEIDVERAQRARQRAEERLKNVTAVDIDFERARAALMRALARLQAAGRVKGEPLE
jgi:F-type H+-transporting ATPase subunit epsilon